MEDEAGREPNCEGKPKAEGGRQREGKRRPASSRLRRRGEEVGAGRALRWRSWRTLPIRERVRT